MEAINALAILTVIRFYITFFASLRHVIPAATANFKPGVIIVPSLALAFRTAEYTAVTLFIISQNIISAFYPIKIKL